MSIRFTRSGLALLLSYLMVTAATTAQQSPASARAQGLIVGQVVDAATGKPVSGAAVGISGPVAPDGRATRNPRVLTGSDGYFVFRDVPAGKHLLQAAKPGYLESASGVRRPNGPISPIVLGTNERLGDVVIRMWRPAAISGRIVDETGDPLIGVQIVALRRTLSGGAWTLEGTESSLTDDRGIYRIGGLTPGEYLVVKPSATHAVLLSTARPFLNSMLSSTGDVPIAVEI